MEWTLVAVGAVLLLELSGIIMKQISWSWPALGGPTLLASPQVAWNITGASSVFASDFSGLATVGFMILIAVAVTASLLGALVAAACAVGTKKWSWGVFVLFTLVSGVILLIFRFTLITPWLGPLLGFSP